VLHTLRVLHQLGLNPSPAEVTASLLPWQGVPFAIYHLLLYGSHPERSPEQPCKKEHFLANSASVISINIKLIKTSVIDILAFVLVSLIYLNICSCSASSFCPRGLN